MATALTLSTTGSAAPRRAPRRASNATRQFQQLATNWNFLDGTAKSSWKALAQQTGDELQPLATPSRDNAYSMFVATNTNLGNSGQPLMTTAPDAHIVPPPLPGLTLTATFGTAGLSLHLYAATAYAEPVMISGARPQLAGSVLYPSTRFLHLGALPSLNTADITALFLKKYRIPSAGYQIMLEVVAVSSTGYRRPPVTITALVTPVTGLELG